MKISCKVMAVTTDTRQIVDTKTGLHKTVKITNVLAQDSEGEVLNCRTFKDDFVPPEAGKSWTVDMRRYEKKGLVADVMF